MNDRAVDEVAQRAVVAADLLGDAEVSELDTRVGLRRREEDVLGLHVEVRHVLLVHVLERS